MDIAPDPWQYLADNHPGVEVYIKPLETWGETTWIDGKATIYLAHDLGAPERRCTLAHEIQHLEVGAPRRSHCVDNEREVVERTARWLIPDLAVLASALSESSLEAAAWTLTVTTCVILDRLDHLTIEEQTQWDALMRLSKPGHAVIPGAVTAALHPLGTAQPHPTKEAELMNIPFRVAAVIGLLALLCIACSSSPSAVVARTSGRRRPSAATTTPTPSPSPTWTMQQARAAYTADIAPVNTDLSSWNSRPPTTVPAIQAAAAKFADDIHTMQTKLSHGEWPDTANDDVTNLILQAGAERAAWLALAAQTTQADQQRALVSVATAGQSAQVAANSVRQDLGMSITRN